MAYEELIELLEIHKLELTRQVAANQANGNPILLEAIAQDLTNNIDALNAYLATDDLDTFKEFCVNYFVTRQDRVPIERMRQGISDFYKVIVALIEQSWTKPEKEKLKAAAIRRIDRVINSITVIALTLDIKRPGKQAE